MSFRTQKLESVSSDKNDMGKLFKSSLEINPGGEPIDPWSEIEKRVIRTNFLRFNLASFNIYYLSLILLFASSAGFSAYTAVSFHRELNKKNAIIRQYQKNELETRIKAYIVDSIKKANDSDKKIIHNEETVPPLANQTLKNIKDKNLINNTMKESGTPDSKTDTIVRITVKKKVIKKQLFVRKQQQVKDSVEMK
jgi:hypothetical protein